MDDTVPSPLVSTSSLSRLVSNDSQVHPFRMFVLIDITYQLTTFKTFITPRLFVSYYLRRKSLDFSGVLLTSPQTPLYPPPITLSRNFFLIFSPPTSSPHFPLSVMADPLWYLQSLLPTFMYCSVFFFSLIESVRSRPYAFSISSSTLTSLLRYRDQVDVKYKIPNEWTNGNKVIIVWVFSHKCSRFP